MLGFDTTLLIVGKGQIAAPSRHGYTTELIPLILSTGQAFPSSSSANSSTAANRENEMAPPSRYVLPKDLDAAIRHLDDQQLDKLVSVALEERSRRKKPIVH